MDLSNKNIIHLKKENIEYLQFKKLLNYENIKHAYVIGLDKDFGKNSVIKEKCYNEICNELNINYNNLLCANQNHTEDIKIINKKINIENDFDGMITNKKNIILSTINADCILMIFYDPIKKVIANIHSGWRGTLKRISEKAVKKMHEEFGCEFSDIICCMSPSICKKHFEVDFDVYNIFKKEFIDLNNENIYSKTTNKYNIDTVLINKIILEKIGLKKHNIIDSGICSVCNKEIIHSYRANGEKAGRSTLLIMLE